MKQDYQTKQTFIGIDISKRVLDICVLPINGPGQLYQIANTTDAIRQWLLSSFEDSRQLVIGMENTGRYNWPLYQSLSEFGATVFVLHPLALSKSLGLARGKTDKIDARRICDYVRTHCHELRPWVSCSAAIAELKLLLSERAARVKSISALKAQRKEYQSMELCRLGESLEALALEQQTTLQAQLKQIEKLIRTLICEDPCLSAQASLVQSVPGAGKVLTWNMLAKTEGFTLITDPRKMACYCGIAPFEHSSGSSVRGKTRVSSYADKAMKKLLHMAALSAIQGSGELKQYYQRMVAAGKNKMSVINAVRNKIIHRIYAVIRNNQPYKPNTLVLAMS
jgi:transposase